MKKRKWIGILVLVLVLAGGGFYFVNGLWGNPVSMLMAERAVKEYIQEQYEDQDLRVEHVNYNFKISGYSAYIVSDTSIDTHFTVDVSMTGKVRYDSYDEVESGWNTYMRLDEEYRNLVEAVFEKTDFPLESDIDYGELKMYEKSGGFSNTNRYGIEISELVKDKRYDILELGKSCGHIVFYVKDKEVTYERASELLLLLKSKLEEANVPFYAIDFVLEVENDSEKPSASEEPRVNVEDFLYEDIYQEGLEKRVEAADRELTAFYEEQDAIRKE